MVNITILDERNIRTLVDAATELYNNLGNKLRKPLGCPDKVPEGYKSAKEMIVDQLLRNMGYYSYMYDKETLLCNRRTECK